jgi:hypothetical protein
MTDTIDDGRWYWKVERADSAGNNSGYSAAATFVLDTEVPAVPIQIAPADESVTDDDTLLFRWSSTPPPAHEISPEYYFIQFSADSQFFNIYIDQQTFSDSLKILSSIFVEDLELYWRVRAQDSAGHSSSYQTTPFSFTYAPYVCGDISGDGTGSNILDLNFLVNYIFRNGSAPDPFISGDVNCGGDVNILDLNYLVNYIFRNGPISCCL